MRSKALEMSKAETVTVHPFLEKLFTTDLTVYKASLHPALLLK